HRRRIPAPGGPRTEPGPRDRAVLPGTGGPVAGAALRAAAEPRDADGRLPGGGMTPETENLLRALPRRTDLLPPPSAGAAPPRRDPAPGLPPPPRLRPGDGRWPLGHARGDPPRADRPADGVPCAPAVLGHRARHEPRRAAAVRRAAARAPEGAVPTAAGHLR